MSTCSRSGAPRSLAALLVAAVLLLASCSDGGDDDPALDTTTTAVTTNGPSATPGPDAGEVGTTTTVTPVVTVPEDALAPGDQPYVTAIAEIAGEGVDRCSVVQLVDLIGAERLRGAGIDPAARPDVAFDSVFAALELTADEASALHDRMVACGHDFVGQMVDDLVSGRTDDPAVISCLQERIDPRAVRDAFVGSLQGLGLDETAFEGLTACFDP